MQERFFKKNEVIFWEGSMGSCLYKIIEGTVSVVLGYGSKEEQKLTELGPGRIFGEMAVLDSWPRSATVVASDDKVRVLEITEKELDGFFESDPDQIRMITKNLSRRLRELTVSYDEACATIDEMRRTRGEIQERKEGLLSRIGKFLNIYNHMLGSRNALEAMERYENIERIREEHGQMRENMRFKKGQVIFRQGDAGDCMYYIGFGTVGIYLDYGTDRQKLLAELQENRFFGEMGIIEKMSRSATAVVMENDTVLTRITEDGLENLFKEDPSFILLVMQHLSSRLRSLTRDYIKACRTISRMDGEEKGGKPMSDEDQAMINYYIAQAQAMNNRWMFY